MRFSLAVLAVAASAFAQDSATGGFVDVFNPTKDQVVRAGDKLTLEWKVQDVKYEGKMAVVQLIGGPEQAKQVPIEGSVADVPISDKKLEFPIDKSLGKDAFYGFVFRLKEDPNVMQYSNPIHITAAEGSAPSTTPPPGAKNVASNSTFVAARPSVPPVPINAKASAMADATVTPMAEPMADPCVDVETVMSSHTPAPVAPVPAPANLVKQQISSVDGPKGIKSAEKIEATTSTRPVVRPSGSSSTGPNLFANEGPVTAGAESFARASSLGLVGAFAVAVLAL